MATNHNIIRRIVFAPGLPKPAAPYSPAVIVDKTMYISGQLGVDSTGELVPGGLEAEAEQAIKNIQVHLIISTCCQNNVTYFCKTE